MIRLMDKILHDLKDSKLWELWYIPYNGYCRILSINSTFCRSPLKAGSYFFGVQYKSAPSSESLSPKLQTLTPIISRPKLNNYLYYFGGSLLYLVEYAPKTLFYLLRPLY